MAPWLHAKNQISTSGSKEKPWKTEKRTNIRHTKRVFHRNFNSWVQLDWKSFSSNTLTFSVQIPDEERKLTSIFIFVLLWGSSKGFLKALKALIWPTISLEKSSVKEKLRETKIKRDNVFMSCKNRLLSIIYHAN